jgi:hypothetical protein
MLRPLRRDQACRFRLCAAWIAFSGLALVGSMKVSAQTVPSDASPSCIIPPSVFATWFQSGSPAVNGAVNPANSVAFPNTPNCSFYQWAEQMFFWMTSPTVSGGRIFDSATFYDVSMPDQQNHRTLLPHTRNFVRVLGVRAAQAGPDGLQVIFDKAGNMLEVERPQSVISAQLRVPDKSGNLVTVAHAERTQTGTITLRDIKGAVIEPRTSSNKRTSRLRLVQKFTVDNVPIFIDSSGNVAEVEVGQADSGVLQAQNGSLIYYATMVNDVYAYFLTGFRNGHIAPGNAKLQFPTTQTELSAITTFAAAHGVSFDDSNALAVEIKTSWIEATGLPNLNTYITINATIPTYDTTNSTDWKPRGQKTTQLALVGMHVVGSTAGHPEMIWATFEHLGNTPNAAYQYISSSGALKTVAQDTAGTWLFSAGNSTGPFNSQHMSLVGQDIKAVSPFKIGPTDTMRWKAWGAAADLLPNPVDGNAAASNTEIIAINNSIRGLMPAGDARTNYVMTGATWTIGGVAPDPAFGAPTPSSPGNQVGTSQLANSTMETYQQGVDNTSSGGGANCFACHSSDDSSIATTAVSHIFSAITKGLF